MTTQQRAQVAAAVCAAAGLGLFQFFGNPVRGYIPTDSLFYWWGFQWVNPASEGEHGWIILGLSAWLFWRNLRTADCQLPIADSQAAQSPIGNWQSAMAMLAALGLHAIGFVAQQTRISIVALLIFTWGGLRLGGGRRWGAAALFPLGFMVFAIPVALLDSVGFWLRVWVVDAGAAIARAAGIGVLQSGTQLLAPDGGYNYDVAAACSGIRSLTAMAALSLLAGYLGFRTWWRRGLLLLGCFPLVYLGNVARIVAIIFAAEAGGPRWGNAAHEIMGYGVFVVVLGGVLGIGSLVRRWWPEEDAATAASLAVSDQSKARTQRSCRGLPALWRAWPAVAGDEADKPGSTDVPPPYVGGYARLHRQGLMEGTRRSGREEDGKVNGVEGWRARFAGPAFVAAIVVLLAVAEMVFLGQVQRRPARGQVGVALAADGLNPVELPAFLGTEWIGRRAEVSAVEREVLPPDTGYSRKLYVNVADPRQQVFLSIVLNGRDRTSIHRPELCLVGQGWTVVERVPHRFTWPGRAPDAWPATLLRVRREVQTPAPAGQPRGRATVPQLVAYCFVGGDGVIPTHGRMVLRDAWNRVLRGRADRWAYVLLQTDATDGEAAALARMQAVLEKTLPALAPQVFAPRKP